MLYQINNSQVATKFQFYTEYEKNMLFWFNIAWNGHEVLKGSKYYKNVEKTHNFRIKSETGKGKQIL